MNSLLISIGTRPELIKVAPIVRHLASRAPEMRVHVVFTGQHDVLLREMAPSLGVVPDETLDPIAAHEPLDEVVGDLIMRMGRVTARISPDAVLAQGDTASVLATALVAHHHRLPFAHVEAGLRTGDMTSPWPEEGYRRAIADLSHWHFAPTHSARQNLLREGIDRHKITVTGNTVIDALMHALVREDVCVPAEITEAEQVVLVTMHRRENMPRRAQTAQAVCALARRHPDVHVVWLMRQSREFFAPAREDLAQAGVTVINALPHEVFVHVMCRADVILTDSGGIQEEAPSLGVPVLVARGATERPEGIEAGVCQLVEDDAAAIIAAVSKHLNHARERPERLPRPSPYGDGRAAERIVDVLTCGACDEFLYKGA